MYEEPVHKHLFSISYKGPTNTSGSRVIVRDERFNKYKKIPFNYELNTIVEMAIEYLQNIGYTIDCYGEFSTNKYIIAVDEFTPINEMEV